MEADALELSFEAIEPIKESIENLLNDCIVEKLPYDTLSTIYVVNDSMVILFEVNEGQVMYLNNIGKNREEMTDNKYIEPGIYNNKCYSIRIVELTYNEIGFRFNNEAFKKVIRKLLDFNGPYIAITFEKFRGYTRLYWCLDVPTDAERIDYEMPKLRLRERYDTWEGVDYYFIFIEFKNADNNVSRAVAYTTSRPDRYINSLCQRTVNTGKFSGDSIRAGYDGYSWALIQKTFDSFKGIKSYKRLEDNLTYFYLQIKFKEKEDVWKKANSLVSDFYNNSEMYDGFERATWLKPVNKWLSEELVYKLAKDIFKQYKVIYQMRPFFLRSSADGQMSYDVFISETNVAIEYQGEQHFKPIDYFGGEESFKKQVQRDREKIALSAMNGVKIVFINYDEIITRELIKDRVSKAIEIST